VNGRPEWCRELSERVVPTGARLCRRPRAPRLLRLRDYIDRTFTA